MEKNPNTLIMVPNDEVFVSKERVEFLAYIPDEPIEWKYSS
jgi:hypothetical protein